MTCKDCKHSEQKDFSTYHVNHGVKTYCTKAKIVVGSQNDSAHELSCFEVKD